MAICHGCPLYFWRDIPDSKYGRLQPFATEEAADAAVRAYVERFGPAQLHVLNGPGCDQCGLNLGLETP